MHAEMPDKRKLEKYFRKAQELFRSRKLAEQQELINLYVEKIIVHADQVEVILNLISLSLQEDYARDITYISRGKIKKDYGHSGRKNKK